VDRSSQYPGINLGPLAGGAGHIPAFIGGTGEIMMDRGNRQARAQSRSLGWSLLVTASLGLWACGGSGGGGSSGAAPNGFVYARPNALYNMGAAIAPNVPSPAQANLSWSVTPALPAGLVLDAASGEIHGAPSVAAALSTYTVRASNLFGAASSELRLGTVRPASFAFAASIADQSISAYLVDPKTGELRPHGQVLPTVGALRPNRLTPSPDGRALYVPYQDSNQLLSFAIDPSSGQLTQTAAWNTGLRPMHLLVHPTANVAFLALSSESAIATYSVDPNTHALSEIAPRTPTGAGPQHLGFDPTARFLYALNTTGSSISTFAIDPLTHLLSPVGGALPTGVSPSDLTMTPDGRFLFVVNSRGHSVTGFSVDTASGALTLLGATPVGSLPIQAKVEPTGRFLYVAVSGEDRVRGFAVDGTSGALSSLGGGWDSGEQPVSLVIDPAGQFLFTGNNDSDDISSFRVDSNSGALTPLTRTRTRDLPLNLVFAQADAPLFSSARFAYVVNRTSQDLTLYTANSLGSLTATPGSEPLGSLPRAASLDPFNRFLFIADGTANTLSARPIDPLDGTAESEASIQPTLADPRSIACDPTGRFVATANFSGSLTNFRYDAAGQLSSLGNHSVGGTPGSVVYDPSGRYLFSANGSANTISRFAVDPQSGALSEILPRITATGRPRALAAHPSGRFLMVTLENIDRIAVFALGDDGSLVLMSAQQTQLRPVAISIDPRGQYAFSANYDPAAIGSVSKFSIDAASGALSSLGVALAGNNPISISVDPSASFVHVVNERSNDVSSFALNRFSGALTPISTASAGTDPAAVVVSFSLN
jgi:6-phosphogluconolactonase (cycloisomerase 2 family)